ncbi:MAG TPA: glutamine-synthetase adenylyltransferase, partial [Rhodospirillales bacterium]|nr:glutamine-synthetase adenylyltransferase [Rhodospirillales bacterium]
MNLFVSSAAPTSPPAPGDRDRMVRGMERWQDAVDDGGDADAKAILGSVLANSSARALAEAIFGNSPYLSKCMIGAPEFSCRLFAQGPDIAFNAVLEDVRAAGTGQGNTAKLLRLAKNRAALSIALADIGDMWPLEKVTGALSEFADLAISAAAASALRTAAARGDLQLTDP